MRTLAVAARDAPGRDRRLPGAHAPTTHRARARAPTRSCTQLAVSTRIQAPRGTFDVLGERRAGARRAGGATRARILEAAGYRRIETPDVRGDRALRPRRRRVHRHRPEGDVHLRQRRGPDVHAAPRGHGAGLPRLPRARHAQAAAAREALVPVELLPPRAAAEGALPPVLAGRRSRRSAPTTRPSTPRRSCCSPSCSRRSAAAACGCGSARSARPRRGRPTARSSRPTCAPTSERLAPEVRRPHRAQPAARLRLRPPRHAGGHGAAPRGCSTASTTRTREHFAAVRAMLDAVGQSLRGRLLARARPRLLHADGLRVHLRRARRAVGRRRRRPLRRADRADRRAADAGHRLGGRGRADAARREHDRTRGAGARPLRRLRRRAYRAAAFRLAADARRAGPGGETRARRPLREGPAQAGRPGGRPLRCHPRRRGHVAQGHGDGRAARRWRPTRSCITSRRRACEAARAATSTATPGAASSTAAREGETVRVAGWVHRRRDHGGLIFIDLRDRSGIVQLVFHPETAPDAFARRRAPAPRARRLGRGRGRRAARRATSTRTSPTGEIEIDVAHGRDARGVRDAAVPGRRGRRRSTRCCACATACSTCAATGMRDALMLRHTIVRGDARVPQRARLPRDRDADPHALDARGRARLPRARAG